MNEETENICTSATRETFPKSCRLRLRNLVEGLFAEGNKLYDFPLRTIWRTMTDAELASSFRIPLPSGIGRVQMMITVPKRKRRHAVDRVLLRRRIREAYRKNRHILEKAMEAKPQLRTLQIAFIYLHDENTDYSRIERKVVKILNKIAESI